MTRPGAAGHSVERLVQVIADLRAHCPWMGALTHTRLVEYLVEECYELVDAIEAVGAQPPPAGSLDELRNELGDVLLQVVLHAQLQSERGGFGLTEVADGLTAKMIRRNPHVFRADGSLHKDFPATVEEIVTTWHAVKRREKPDRATRYDGIPHHLPALALAAKTVQRAGAAEPAGPSPMSEEELGTRLFAVVRVAAGQGLDPERALRTAVRRFQAGHSAGITADVTDGN